MEVLPYRIIFTIMDLEVLIARIIPIVQEAAAFILSQAGKVSDRDIETKSRNSLVSYVDKTAENILVNGLRSILPASGFITEEETVAQSNAEYTWIIDPLDGTTNFLHNIPFYSVSVALQHGQELLAGIVHDVVHQESYYAWKGGGAWCNGLRVHVSDHDKIIDTVVATGFPYSATNVTPAMVSVFDYFLKNARGIRRLGSAALDLAYVANGRFDVYYETSLNAWDIAGGTLLVMEAGGKVSDFKGGQQMLIDGRIIASNGKVHSEAAGIIQNYYPH
ncbi:MAG TPA: inositol monophosphatase family protein [Saprospiraceae bacterium]|nr:inositol monophosphatase family protein [Saprospiraceae bacterium]